MTELELDPLFVRYLDTEPIKVDPVGCKDIADFIKEAKKKFSPLLDEFSLCHITLHLSNDTKLKGDIKITTLIFIKTALRNPDSVSIENMTPEAAKSDRIIN